MADMPAQSSRRHRSSYVRERRRLRHRPTIAQLRAIARFEGSRPCSYRPDRADNWLPEALPTGSRTAPAACASAHRAARSSRCPTAPGSRWPERQRASLILGPGSPPSPAGSGPFGVLRPVKEVRVRTVIAPLAREVEAQLAALDAGSAASRAATSSGCGSSPARPPSHARAAGQPAVPERCTSIATAGRTTCSAPAPGAARRGDEDLAAGPRWRVGYRCSRRGGARCGSSGARASAVRTSSPREDAITAPRGR